MGFCKFSKFSFGLFLFVFFFFAVSYEEESAQILEDRASLFSFMSRIISDPEHTLESWNSSRVHVCDWSGVRCNIARDRVIELDLSGRSLRGTISPSISNLSFLTILDLSSNFFQGRIPAELGRLSHLKQLSLSSNLFEGKIPSELGFLTQLVYLSLGTNRLAGEIPEPLFCNGSYSSLQYLDLSNNSINGLLPLNDQCRLRELRFLLLWSNNFTGRVPGALSNSSKLEWLDLESNSLSGELPSEMLSRMPRIQYLYLSYNYFISHNGNTNLKPFFDSLANSSNLQELELAGNNIGGELLPSIIDSLPTNLVQIQLDENIIHGSIPPEIRNLVNLTLLNLSGNLLNGSIPPDICRLEKLERLYLSNNLLSGEIPPDLGNVPHLGLLDLSKNKLSRSIPDSFSDLPQLRRLLLYQNQLSGTIPKSLGKCIILEILDLSRNAISGAIPGELIAGLSSLKLYLNLSGNHLEGLIPLELSKMDMVLAIDLSSNNLSGTIPSQLGSCIALEQLNLSGNGLEGLLPASIGQLPYLQDLDVSFNRLTGEIPESLQESSSLKLLNFSFNDFHGNVLNTGAFSTLNVDSFWGNRGLCGSIEGLRSCRNKWSPRMILPILLSSFAALMVCTFSYRLVIKLKFTRQFEEFSGRDVEDGEEERKRLKYPRVSHRELVEATGGFSSSSLIGSGRFGRVYMGVLRDNTRIAVKVLNFRAATAEISRSFRRECRVLKRTRHKNLIRIITICCRPEFKAVVLPLMPNGNLENHLYPRHGLREALNLAQLVAICSGVADGMAYLHHHSPVKVVHCDLKPSNILLDEDMTAVVADFGIARVVKGGGGGESVSVYDSVSFTSTDGLLCGSVGYIAPEYGLGKRASTQGDVYSFGVLLLEIVTGKRPADAFLHHGSSLPDWVKSIYPHKLEPVVEEALQRCAPPRAAIAGDGKRRRDVILELIELGLICTQYNPSTRPNMSDVAHEMARLKQYLSSSPSDMAFEEAYSKKVSVR
ncbi:hypothetical protein U1Q18_018314 [Sarracenia purpurea var. burkii]